MRKGLFWLNDKQWAQIEPHLPTNQTGPARDDDRRIISGIVHMLQCGARWRDCPPDYGPYTTIYNRFNRWAKRGHWQAIFEALARCGKDGVTLSIDSTSIKAHRSASGGKGGSNAAGRDGAARRNNSAGFRLEKFEQAIGRSRGNDEAHSASVFSTDAPPIIRSRIMVTHGFRT